MLRTAGLVFALALFLAACGGSSSGTVSGVQDAMPPRRLQYELGYGEVGQPFGPFAPSVVGTVSNYSVSPALPAGLALDPKTGAISGTPQAKSDATYTVTATNSAGVATASITITVFVPPTLAYATPVTATLGTALTLVPRVSGDANWFYVLPPLPAGLTLDYKTGIISGIPSAPTVAVTYTIVTYNAATSGVSADLELSVEPGPVGTAVAGAFHGETVSGLAYASGAHRGLTDGNGGFTFEVGRGITFSVGAVAIGTVPIAKTLVTPVDLTAGGTGTSTRVLNVVRFLMMLDRDANPNNGIQISPAVSAAAANWPSVDFDTADLPGALSTIIPQASAADGGVHVLPDAATAEAHLRNGFYCNRAAVYNGTYTSNAAPEEHDFFMAAVMPDGTVHSAGWPGFAQRGFDVQEADAMSPSLDGSFAESAPASPISQAAAVQGKFADATVLKGTYQAGVAGTFQAVANANVSATYKFFGTYTVTPNDPAGTPFTGPSIISMDDANNLSGGAGGTLAAIVSGSTFGGTVTVRPDPYSKGLVSYPVSGTYSNTPAGITLTGQYSMKSSVVTFTSVGCRAN